MRWLAAPTLSAAFVGLVTILATNGLVPTWVMTGFAVSMAVGMSSGVGALVMLQRRRDGRQLPVGRQLDGGGAQGRVLRFDQRRQLVQFPGRLRLSRPICLRQPA